MLTMRNMTTQMRLFFVATLTPACLLAFGAFFGGAWVALAVLYMTGLTSLLDRISREISSETEFPSGNVLSVTLGFAHLALLPIVIVALAGQGLNLTEKFGLFFAAGLFFGQVSNANAHELIHRASRRLHHLGMWIYISLLFGHHTSAHLLVHHTHVATAHDPNTSRKGESFYRYALRAWVGSFREGYKAEAKRLANINRPAWRNPYLMYIAGGVTLMAVSFFWGGVTAVLAYVALAVYAQSQLLLSDYVQHYGLVRRVDDAGKSAPVDIRHSWNSPHWFSSALMLNATRHSDHHAHPTRPYPALSLPDDAPMLPKPLPLMASIALFPPLWRRIMDPLAERWRHA